MLQVSIFYLFNFNFVVSKSPKLVKDVKFVPREILTTIFGFLPRKDLNNNLFVSKTWRKIIENSGKQLPQRQEIEMHIPDQHNGAFYVDFSTDEKIVSLTEGKAYNTRRFAQNNILVVGGRKDVEFLGLKNCIVESHMCHNVVQFVEIFSRIKDLMGGHLVPIKEFCLYLHGEEDPLQALSHFRYNYSSK